MEVVQLSMCLSCFCCVSHKSKIYVAYCISFLFVICLCAIIFSSRLTSFHCHFFSFPFTRSDVTDTIFFSHLFALCHLCLFLVRLKILFNKRTTVFLLLFYKLMGEVTTTSLEIDNSSAN